MEIKPLNCSAAILNWTTMLGLLRRLSAAQLQMPDGRDGDRWALPPGYVGLGMEDID